MSFELSQLSFSELRQVAANIEKEFKARQGGLFKEARAEVREVERKYGLTIEDIIAGKQTASKGGAPREGKSVAPKYRNPNNSEQTWTGRGKRPLWLEEALAQGTPLSQFLI